VKDIDRLKEKVRKLLAQAVDREGTPEGEVYYRRAFEIMANHGFDERDVGRPGKEDGVTHRTVEFTGSYTDMQAALLLALAAALHCTGLMRKAHSSTRVLSVTLFGTRRHLERVEMLHALLSPAMLIGARRHSSAGWHDTSTVVKRRSFMTGFAQSVAARLSDAENQVADENPGYVLVLVDDLALARQAQDRYLSERGLGVSTLRVRRSWDGTAYGDGMRAGAETDLGRERLRRRPALPG